MAITPFEQANFNLMNLADGTVDLFDSTPKDVSIQQKDSNGNIYTKNIQNRGKFQEKVWDDVGAALGQFDRIFYVDSENGDDTNDGSSSNPFATIQKAINIVPFGGNIEVHLLSDYTMASGINISGKKVFISLGGHTLTLATFNVYDSNNVNVGTGIYRFYTGRNATIHLRSGTIEIPSLSSTGNGNQWYWSVYRVFIQLGNPDSGMGFYAAGFSSITLNIGANAYAVGRGDKGTNNYPANGFIAAGRFNTTTNLDSDGGNGFAINVQQLIE